MEWVARPRLAQAVTNELCPLVPSSGPPPTSSFRWHSSASAWDGYLAQQIGELSIQVMGAEESPNTHIRATQTCMAVVNARGLTPSNRCSNNRLQSRGHTKRGEGITHLHSSEPPLWGNLYLLLSSESPIMKKHKNMKKLKKTKNICLLCFVCISAVRMLCFHGSNDQ